MSQPNKTERATEGGRVSIGGVATYVRKRAKEIMAVYRWSSGEQVPTAEMTASVSCNGCHACCHMDVTLYPSEGGDGLETEVRNGKRLLKRRADGSCIHLVDGKCTVYANRPIACRGFDCRDYAVTAVKLEGYPRINQAIERWRPELKCYDDRKVYARITWVARNLAQELQAASGLSGAALAIDTALTTYAIPVDALRERLRTIIAAARAERTA